MSSSSPSSENFVIEINHDVLKCMNIVKGRQGLIIPKTKAIWLSQKEKDLILKKEAASAFATAIARKKRALDNKWFRWKYFDQIFEESDWLEEANMDMGWAIGRRIYEKTEIEVTKIINEWRKYFDQE